MHQTFRSPSLSVSLLSVVLATSFWGCSSKWGQLQLPTVSPSANWTLIANDIGFKTVDSILTIESKTNPASPLFRIPLDKAFLVAGSGNPKIQYRMAAFKIEDKVVSLCTEQSIDSILVIQTSLKIQGKLYGKDCSTEYTANFSPKSATEMDFSFQVTNPNINRLWLRTHNDPDESILGLGEQFSNIDFKGKKPFLLTEEQGIGRGDQPITAGANLIAGAGGNEYTSYAPIPFYMTTKHRAVFLENSGYIKFDFSHPKLETVEVWDTNKDRAPYTGGIFGTVWIGKDPKDLLASFTKKTGRYSELPDWAYGTILGLQGGTAKVKKIIQDQKSLGNPVTALWIQDWCGRRVTNFGDQLQWKWIADEKLYPDFKNFVKEMNGQNVKVLGYVNSFLADKDPKKPGEEFTNPQLEEAKAKGYLVKNAKGEDYLIQTVGFPAYLIDLTNPAAVTWIKDIIKKNMIEVGLSGWMADFGEWLPTDAVLHSGISAKVYHNIYPVDWARINREAIREAKKEKDIVFFTRAGYSYSSQHSTLFWEGDQMVSFGEHDGLPSAVVGLLSGGLSGIAYNHSDIGGYTTIDNPIRNYHRTKELTQRWAEMSAFTLIYRTHEGNKPLKNWQVYSYTNPAGVSSKGDAETSAHFARMGKVHFALKDYLKELSKEAISTGLPIARHPYLHYPSDKKSLEYKTNFLLGEDLFVAPVVYSGKDSVKAYLPAGDWEHVWTQKVYKGGAEYEVNAPIGSPAVWIRVGSKNYSKLKQALSAIQ